MEEEEEDMEEEEEDEVEDLLYKNVDFVQAATENYTCRQLSPTTTKAELSEKTCATSAWNPCREETTPAPCRQSIEGY